MAMIKKDERRLTPEMEKYYIGRLNDAFAALRHRIARLSNDIMPTKVCGGYVIIDGADKISFNTIDSEILRAVKTLASQIASTPDFALARDVELIIHEWTNNKVSVGWKAYGVDITYDVPIYLPGKWVNGVYVGIEE